MWYLNTCKNTIFLHVKISIISLTSGLSLKLYLNSLVYHRNIFGSSSKVLVNLRTSSENFRKFSENVRERLSGLRDNLKNLRKSSEGGRKSSENHQKRRHQYVYIINRMIHGRLEIWNLSSRVHIRYLTRSLRSLVRYRWEHSKRNSTSPRDHVLFSIYVACKIRRSYKGSNPQCVWMLQIYFQMQFSSFNLYYKRFQWSPLSDFEKFANFSFINGTPRLALSTCGHLFRTGILEWGISLKSFWHVIFTVVAYRLTARTYFYVILFTLITNDVSQS